MPTPAPPPEEALVAALVAARRRALGLSQGALAERIGVTWWMVQKYENGDARISVGRLLQIAAALDCSAAELLAPVDHRPERPSAEEALLRAHALGAAELVAAWGRLTPLSQRSLLRLLHTLKGSAEA
ncbi:helix-turn-helix domain-containing protein [Phenylobacterium deserti]|uniref:Transcriptional regulator n=1 Tax=Phenylobacterium deserti TaxID=1914756 RepID=A0A328ACT0_9CAUL|nr:helix-turn-helix transcriptional regulator [Phenylobacterium deserti]RAK52623.1 transcriptional regulator [Phenylobacterium deserti]